MAKCNLAFEFGDLFGEWNAERVLREGANLDFVVVIVVEHRVRVLLRWVFRVQTEGFGC